MSLVKTVFCSHGDAETQSDMVNSLRTLREPNKGISRRVRRERREFTMSLFVSASPCEQNTVFTRLIPPPPAILRYAPTRPSNAASSATHGI